MNPLEKAMLAAGASNAVTEVRPRLVLSIDGWEFSGKTRLCLTAPKPLVYLSTDYGDEGVIQPFMGPELFHRELVWHDKMEAVKGDEIKAWMEQNVLTPFDRIYSAALDNGARTIVLDSGSQLAVAVRLAKLGKLKQAATTAYDVVNAWWAERVRMALNSNTNLLIIHQYKDEWVDQPPDSNNPGAKVNRRKTGLPIRDGNEKMQFLAQAEVECRRVPRRGKLVRWEAEIMKSRHAMDEAGNTATGTVIEDPSFPVLAATIAPQIPMEAWL